FGSHQQSPSLIGQTRDPVVPIQGQSGKCGEHMLPPLRETRHELPRPSPLGRFSPNRWGTFPHAGSAFSPLLSAIRGGMETVRARASLRKTASTARQTSVCRYHLRNKTLQRYRGCPLPSEPDSHNRGIVLQLRAWNLLAQSLSATARG